MKCHPLLILIITFASVVSTLLKAEEILLYAHDGFMGESDGGFLWMTSTAYPYDFLYLDTDRALNTNMETPIDYRGGEIHVYMHIHFQPEPRNMRVCFNIHQPYPGGDLPHEIGTRRENIVGEAGNEYTWVYELDSYGGWSTTENFWVAYGRNDLYIDWASPRSRYTVRFWNAADKEVHTGGGKNWSGEDPKKWFPFHFTYMVVAVEKGGVFSGWENYVTEDGYSFLRASENAASDYFSGLRALAGRGQMRSSWFGTLDILDFPTIIHKSLGVIYCAGEGKNTFWMYLPMDRFGWCWTSPAHYPYIYLQDEGTWAYYYKGSTDPAWFYLYKTKEWVSRVPAVEF